MKYNRRGWGGGPDRSSLRLSLVVVVMSSASDVGHTCQATESLLSVALDFPAGGPSARGLRRARPGREESGVARSPPAETSGSGLADRAV